MENSIRHVQGKENLFNRYIHDCEKELKQEKSFKRQTTHLKNLLECYLKQLQKVNRNEDKIKKACMLNTGKETKEENCKIITPLTKIMDIIEYNFDSVVNKLLETFELQLFPKDVFKKKGLDLPINENVSTKVLIKNKRRKGYYVNCNRIRKFNNSYKKTRNDTTKSTASTDVRRGLQDLKNIIDLANTNNNSFIDWMKYGQKFSACNEVKITADDIIKDKNKTHMNSVNFISHLANIRRSQMDTIIFYNDENKQVDNDEKDHQLSVQVDQSHSGNDEPSVFDHKKDEIYKDEPKSSEYQIYSGTVDANLYGASNTKRKENKGKDGRISKMRKLKIVKKKKAKKRGKTKERRGTGLCCICRKIKNCLCGTKPDIISESPSDDKTIYYKELDLFQDPEAYYDQDEDDFLKKTYVYSVISEPQYNTDIPKKERSKMPTVCSVEMTGYDTGSIVIKEGSKFHNLGFKINDWSVQS